MRNIIVIACLLSLTVACQHSPKRNYYYLTPLSVETTQQNTSSDALQIIGIGPVEIAEYLHRSQIIDNQSDNTLKISENAYWAEPLDKSIARVLSLNLTQLNNTRSFVNFPWRTDSKPHYSLRVRIDSLARNGSNASINATWELIDNEAKRNIVHRNFVQSQAVDSGAQALAHTYSKLLAALAKDMDVELNKVH